LLLVHITAIFIPPFSLQTSGPAGTSPVADFLMWTFRPYIDVAFLNHGYAFFAPNPGPSHLLRARVTLGPPREPVEETFPDLQEQWPRADETGDPEKRTARLNRKRPILTDGAG
jgi:hypothetical protein